MAYQLHNSSEADRYENPMKWQHHTLRQKLTHTCLNSKNNWLTAWKALINDRQFRTLLAKHVAKMADRFLSKQLPTKSTSSNISKDQLVQESFFQLGVQLQRLDLAAFRKLCSRNHFTKRLHILCYRSVKATFRLLEKQRLEPKLSGHRYNDTLIDILEKTNRSQSPDRIPRLLRLLGFSKQEIFNLFEVGKHQTRQR